MTLMCEKGVGPASFTSEHFLTLPLWCTFSSFLHLSFPFSATEAASHLTHVTLCFCKHRVVFLQGKPDHDFSSLSGTQWLLQTCTALFSS